MEGVGRFYQCVNLSLEEIRERSKKDGIILGNVKQRGFVLRKGM